MVIVARLVEPARDVVHLALHLAVGFHASPCPQSRGAGRGEGISPRTCPWRIGWEIGGGGGPPVAAACICAKGSVAGRHALRILEEGPGLPRAALDRVVILTVAIAAFARIPQTVGRSREIGDFPISILGGPTNRSTSWRTQSQSLLRSKT